MRRASPRLSVSPEMANQRRVVRRAQPRTHPEPPAHHEWWDEDGIWKGPHDLKVFLRSPGTRFFALWWLFILTFLSIGFIASVLPPTFWGWFTPLLALAFSAPLTLGLMFCFSRGWIGDGD